ncbi:MAG: ABC transporter ATP-binding protein [Pseudomonadota bacterium]
MSTAALEVKGLRITARTDEGPASLLDGVGFTVRPGTIMGLVGESGCGKSTTSKAILGILSSNVKVEQGQVLLHGEDILGLSERQLFKVRGSGIAFIPQDPYLAVNPVFTIGRQLLEIMRWHAPGPQAHETERVPARLHRSRLIALMKRVQLPDPEGALERYPHQFSGGQRQRLLIVAALCCDPRVVIADEPTTALDVTTQNEILLLLKEIVAERGLSMLFVTHDLGVVAQLCDDLTVMYAGQTVETGPTARVLNHPRHPYTAALIACHPERSGGLVGIPGSVPSPLNAPPGCRYEARCGSAQAGCTVRPPYLRPVARGHLVNCIHFDDLDAREAA